MTTISNTISICKDRPTFYTVFCCVFFFFGGFNFQVYYPMFRRAHFGKVRRVLRIKCNVDGYRLFLLNIGFIFCAVENEPFGLTLRQKIRIRVRKVRCRCSKNKRESF